jgi:hypothetical protein
VVCLKKCLTGETVLEMDVKRPTRPVEELHQVAATRTERRQPVQVTSPNRTSWALAHAKGIRNSDCRGGETLIVDIVCWLAFDQNWDLSRPAPSPTS